MDASIRDVIANAIRYWERGRILYNAVLAAIVIGYFVANWPVSGVRFSFDLAQFLFVLAVLANIAYCAAYPVDVFVQMSSVRTAWLRFRRALFAVGLLLAAIVARFIAGPMFK